MKKPFYSVRETIIRTLGSFDITFGEELVEEIEKTAREKNPQNLHGMVYTIARNKAIDIIRQRGVSRRATVEKLLRAEKERQEQETVAAAKTEFWQAGQRAINQIRPLFRAKAQENLFLLWLVALEGETGLQIQKRFPSKTLMAIRKGTERARALVKPFASPKLWKILARNTCGNAENKQEE